MVLDFGLGGAGNLCSCLAGSSCSFVISAHRHEQERRLDSIGGEKSFMKVNKVVQPRRSNEGEPSRISTVNESSHLSKLSTEGEPHRGDTIPTDTIANDEPTIVVTADESSTLLPKSTTKLVDDEEATPSLLVPQQVRKGSRRRTLRSHAI